VIVPKLLARALPFALACLAATSSSAADGRLPEGGLVDVGLRIAYARPVGAFDVGTHATDVSFGGIPFALDATVRLTPPSSSLSSWSVAAGLYAAYGPTIPTLCTDTSSCIASIGHDTELDLLARVRAPRLAFVVPEGEVGTGWSWSSRSLVDQDVTSTRRWNGPVILRAALVPSLVLGARTRLGLVVGGSVARSTSFTLEAPGVERHGVEGARLHGTLDLGVRFAVVFGG
jgi:hypothetical protein